jgi:MoxR-like ATPase
VTTTANIRSQRDDSRDLELLDQLARARSALNEQIARRIVGQRETVDNLVATILAGGHALLVGVPGLAKTLLVQTVAQALDLDFSRVQFTPDLMPSDITGTELLEEDHATGRRFFKFVHGPVFGNVVLADEINRAPPKTQAALLQAMQEHAVTTAGRRTSCPSRSSCWRRRTRSSRRGRIRSPKRSSTGSWCSSSSDIRAARRRSESSPRRRRTRT